MIVVFDASTFVSAALKANSLPEQALLRAVTAPNRLSLSRAVEDEFREVIFRPKFERFVTVERRQRILDIVIFAAERVEPTEIVRECSDPKDDKYLALAAGGGADVIGAATRVTCFRCIPGAGSSSCPRRTFLRFLDEASCRQRRWAVGRGTVAGRLSTIRATFGCASATP